MIPENKLTGAERGVLAAFRAGASAADVARTEIRGDFLRGLFLGTYDKEADYRGTRIIGAVIPDALDMEFCETKFPVRFHDCFFAQEIKSQRLVCPESDFSNCVLKKGIDAMNAKVAGDVNMTKVHAMDQVWMPSMEVGGRLDCSGGIFQNNAGVALFAQSIKVVAGVGLCEGFNAMGGVSLSSAVIGGQFDCTGGVFQSKAGRALNAHSIRVAGSVFLCGEFKGEVNFIGADIRGQLVCTDGSFQNEEKVALIVQCANVDADVILASHKSNEKDERRRLLANGLVSFVNATIGGNLMLNNCALTRMSLAGANVLGEFQDDAGIYKNDQGDNIDLDIDGFCYRRLDAAKERVKDRLAWAGLMSKGDKFRPQPYEQLMKVYREMGHMNWARDAGFALEEKRHGVMNSWMWKGWYRVLRHTIGYGYKPFRALTHWFAPLIVAGIVLFGWSSFFPDSCRAGNEPFYCMAPSDAGVLLSDDWKIHGKLPKDYPDFSPVYYAVETALPVLPLGQTENWHPKTWWVRRAQAAITIIGALVLTVLASYGVGVLGPRWKNE